MQQPFDTYIFVQLGPVNPFSVCDEAPGIALGGGSVKQTRKPRERYRYGPAVRKVNTEGVRCHLHLLSPCFSQLNLQSTHSNSSAMPPRSVAHPACESRGHFAAR